MRSLLDVHVLASSRDTWLGADRPLRGDELISLGLAVRMFGTTPEMPPVVDEAARCVTDDLWTSVHRRSGDDSTGAPDPSPYRAINFVLGLRGASRTEASPREVAAC